MNEEFENSVKGIRTDAGKELMKAIGGTLIMSLGCYIFSKHTSLAGFMLGQADTLERVNKTLFKHE